MTDAPAPLLPAEVDLRGLPFMPLHGDRLFSSETWLSATAEAKVAALRLWWRAYAGEVPAASLPDNDNLLAEYAGYGVAVKAWLKVRGQALRGWIKCSDGRLWHPVVADIAKEAWEGRKRNRAKQKRWRERNRGQDGQETVTPPVTETATLRLCNAGEGKGEGQTQGELRKEERNNTAGAAAEYAFEGKIVRLNRADFDRWAGAFPKIPDLRAELHHADAWYTDNPPKGGKWFHAVANWLKKANADADNAAAQDGDALSEARQMYARLGVS